jgi:hypothetical protein
MEGPKNDYFKSSNQEIYPIDFMVSKKDHGSQKPISIKISGPLAEKEVLNEGRNDIEIPLLSTDCRIIYTVQIDDKSGSIFWYEIKEMEGNMDIEAVAQKILKTIRFRVNEDSFVTTGEVEIYFNEGVG